MNRSSSPKGSEPRTKKPVHVPGESAGVQEAAAPFVSAPAGKSDKMPMFAPVTKASQTLSVASQVAETLHKAFALAQRERPGAVFLAIPEDVEKLFVAEDAVPLLPPPKVRFFAGDKALSEAAAHIENAQNPVMLVGHGAARTGAAAEVMAFADAVGLPVTTTFMAKGIIDDRHP
ncbi:MAG: hypothetical protein EON91_12320, partial [Brevundimonas sp.]